MKGFNVDKLSRLAMMSLLGANVSCVQLQTGVTDENAPLNSAQQVGNLAQVARVAALAVIGEIPEPQLQEPVLCAMGDNTLIGLQTSDGKALNYICESEERRKATRVIEIGPNPEFQIIGVPISGSVLNIKLTTDNSTNLEGLTFAALTTENRWTTLSTNLGDHPPNLFAHIGCELLYIDGSGKVATWPKAHTKLNLANSDSTFAVTCTDQGDIKIATKPTSTETKTPQDSSQKTPKTLQTLTDGSNLTITTQQFFEAEPLHANYADYEGIHTFLRTHQYLGNIPGYDLPARDVDWADFLIAQKDDFFDRYWDIIPYRQLPKDDKYIGSVSVSLNSRSEKSDYYGIRIGDMCTAFREDLSPKTFQTLFKKLPNGNYWPNTDLLEDEKRLEKLLLKDPKFVDSFLEASQTFLYKSPVGYFMSCGGNTLIRIAKFQKHRQAQGFGASIGNFYGRYGIDVSYDSQKSPQTETIEATFSCDRGESNDLIGKTYLSLHELAQRRANSRIMKIPVPLYTVVIDKKTAITATCDELGAITFSYTGY